jgi:predicted metal-binding protein
MGTCHTERHGNIYEEGVEFLCALLHILFVCRGCKEEEQDPICNGIRQGSKDT